MSERVYHVQSTGQMVVLHPAVVKQVISDLEAKQDALGDDLDRLRAWLQKQPKEEQCASRRTTGESSLH